jgi:hypothetical protein
VSARRARTCGGVIDVVVAVQGLDIGLDKAGLEQQVLWWITGHGELGKGDQVDVEFARRSRWARILFTLPTMVLI